MNQGKTEISYGNAIIKIYERSDGNFIVSWREDGRRRKSTRASLERATTFAKAKARQIDQATGRQWITPAQHERLHLLENLAGENDPGKLLIKLEEALKILGGNPETLIAAAQFYLTHGPPSVRPSTFREAEERVLGELRGRHHTDMMQELRTWSRDHGDMPLLDITAEMLSSHILKDHLAPRSQKNRITRWSTFFRRCQEIELWPQDRRIPTASIKRPRLPDKAPEIFSPEQGRQLLELVRREKPEHLPYLLLAGWMAVRPSECLRLTWEDVLWDQVLLHISTETAGKTSRERWVPIPKKILSFLKHWKQQKRDHRSRSRHHICMRTSDTTISALARANGLKWTHDVLRHSAITYRLQVLSNIEKTADEAGNSPEIIRSTYRRPIPPGEGKKWFDLLKKL